MAGKPTVLVTGANGFIGGWATEAIHLSRFANARAGIKNWVHAARIARLPISIVPCDVLNRDQVRAAVQGVDYVVHCAVGDRTVVVNGTRNVLDAARNAGVQRVVHMSTAEVYGPVHGEIDETCPYQYTGGEYGDSKIDAEKVCWEYSQNGLSVTVLRPSIVYGPFSETWTMDLANRLQSGNWATFDGYGDGTCNLIYIDDLISAVLAALTHLSAAGEAFNLNGPDQVTWNRYFEEFNAALGLPELRSGSSSRSRIKSATSDLIRSSSRYVLDRFSGPIWGIRQRYNWAEEMVAQMKRIVKSTPTAHELQSLYSRDAHYAATKALNLLAVTPRTDLASGLAKTVRWLDCYGLIKQPAPAHMTDRQSAALNKEKAKSSL